MKIGKYFRANLNIIAITILILLVCNIYQFYLFQILTFFLASESECLSVSDICVSQTGHVATSVSIYFNLFKNLLFDNL